MSFIKKVRQVIQYCFQAPLQVIDYVSAAVTRIFGPNDDQYPATGVQPFEGEPADQKKIRHQQF